MKPKSSRKENPFKKRPGTSVASPIKSALVKGPK